jgi:hypothetical protein
MGSLSTVPANVRSEQLGLRWAICILIAGAFSGCEAPSDGLSETAHGTAACAPTQTFPYPDGPYVGVHAGPANNDVVRCDTAESYSASWHAAKGFAVAQPNTFSPDGTVTYITTSQPKSQDCNVWALSVDTGELVWCKSLSEGAIWSAVEVDENGDLFFTTTEEIISLDATGDIRWQIDAPAGPDMDATNGAIGLHFTPKGHIATVTDQGIVLLIDRKNGSILASLDIPAAFEVSRPIQSEGSIQIDDFLPAEIIADFASLQEGPPSELLSVFAGAANFSDNTIGIAPNGTLYVIGGGNQIGGLFQVQVGGTDDAPTLVGGWMMVTHRGSASSPAISPDGRLVKVSDGNGDGAFLVPENSGATTKIADIESCDANTDGDPDPQICLEAIGIPLLTGPTLGTTPLLNDGVHYQYEIQFADLLNTDTPDIRAFSNDVLLWEKVLPDDLQWTSVITVSDNHLIGTATALTPSEEKVLTIEFPRSAASELILLNRHTGEVVFRAPTTDDSTSTVTIGHDGSLYVTMLTLVHTLSIETRPVAGIMRFVPDEN